MRRHAVQLAVLVAGVLLAGALVPAARAGVTGEGWQARQLVTASPAAPAAYRFDGGGWGHGVGMSQYGAYDMGLRGFTAARILRFYYPGTRLAPARLPRELRVGILQADRDPATGKPLEQVLVRGLPLPGRQGGALVVEGQAQDGGRLRAFLPAGRTYALVPEQGGLSVLAAGERLLGPTRPGSGVRVRYQSGPPEPALLELPQARRTLRWGWLDVQVVRAGDRDRPRAVAVMGWEAYLRGLAEVPPSWPGETLKAQAIAARSYALATVLAAGQHRGQGDWRGCDCGVYADTRDQQYLGWAREAGRGAASWAAAVRSTGSTVLTWQGKPVKAFYASSNGGHTQSVTVWGGPPRPYLPAKPDPYDAARGRNPHFRWQVIVPATTLTATLSRYRLGSVTGVRVAEVDASGRARQVRVTGTRGQVTLAGGDFRRLTGLKSTKFTVRRAASPPPGGEVRQVRLAPAPGQGRRGAQAAAAAAAAWRSAEVPSGRARLAALSWAGGPGGRDARVWLRARDGRGWSPWWAMAPADGGPDAGSAEARAGRGRVASEPAWLPPGTRAVQVSVAAGGPRDLTLHLVDPGPAGPPALRGGAAGAWRGAAGEPAIITRAQWGADERLRRHPPAYASTVKAAFLHHTAGSAPRTPEESAALVRGIYLWHVRGLGWNDIGYHFLVDRFGQVFEGRAGGMDRPVVGACTGGFNQQTTCVALIGNFTSTEPPAPMRAALLRLLAWKLSLTDVDPLGTTELLAAGHAGSRHRRGERVRLPTVAAHRDVSYTACPGDRAYALLPSLRAALAARRGT